jgi:hypothetical protein
MIQKLPHRVDWRDEERHRPEAEPLWSESYYADFVSDDGELAGYLRLGLYPNQRVSWWTAMITKVGQPLIAWTDYELPIPVDGTLQLRARGLELTLDTAKPLEEFTIRASGTGEVHSRPEAIYEGEVGQSIDLCLDLKWRTDGSPYHYDLTTRYEIPCLVAGRLRLGDQEISLSGSGQRDHSWGVRDWWSLAWCWASTRLDDGTRIHVTDVRFPNRPAFGYIQSARGIEPVSTLTITEEIGDHGFPYSARIKLDPGGLDLAVYPLAFGPLLLRANDGRVSRFPRAMARYEASDGRRGLGWIEWNQPTLIE